MPTGLKPDFDLDFCPTTSIFAIRMVILTRFSPSMTRPRGPIVKKSVLGDALEVYPNLDSELGLDFRPTNRFQGVFDQFFAPNNTLDPDSDPWASC